MKKLIVTFLLFFSIAAGAQFNYTSTVKYSDGQLVVNKIISLRFNIKLGSATGTTVYREMQHPLTDNQGNVVVAVGTGVAELGNFSQINWAQGNHYLTVEFYTGPVSCEWINVPFGTSGEIGQIVSYCGGEYVFNSCNVFTNLVWSDEFNTNGAVSATNWHHQTQLPNGNSWYNGEVQHYTNRQVNSNVNNGVLSIVAKKETFTDQGQTKQYTSARLNSKFAFKYGRVEVRAKLPTGAGTWPAIWMLGKNIIEPGAYWSSTHGTTFWPACGEVDIMEHWGNNQNYVQSAMHTPSSFGGTVNIGGQIVSTASTQFHIYTLEWTSERMTFSVDGLIHYVYNPTVKDANTWPFDSDQYILLNVAMQPAIDPLFTQSAMEVDYVRVYQ
ncbi:glycoside hydrolase family 16 protein [Flavobacterium sp. IMCC34852]|uniref:Glycoside hydrolase family 16 protein n=1 Tax=Flavobacterium rivulicola TaxID=2732161 RepID=A0A7Y3R6I6_9FLAO|nr:glycoside hydrolase family 16 protein [Flavobacterium sp. IMCC34852]